MRKFCIVSRLPLHISNLDFSLCAHATTHKTKKKKKNMKHLCVCSHLCFFPFRCVNPNKIDSIHRTSHSNNNNPPTMSAKPRNNQPINQPTNNIATTSSKQQNNNKNQSPTTSTNRNNKPPQQQCPPNKSIEYQLNQPTKPPPIECNNDGTNHKTNATTK